MNCVGSSRKCGKTGESTRLMRKSIFLFPGIFLLIIMPVRAGEDYPFQLGEENRYTAAFNFIQAGYSTMTVAGIDTVVGYPVYRLVWETRSSGLIDQLFRVRDRLESFMDVETLFSRGFRKQLREGRYRKDYAVRFDYQDSLAITARDSIPIHSAIHDMLSIFYFIRAQELQVGQIFRLNTFDNNKFIPYNLIVKERVPRKVEGKTVDCFVLEPFAPEGELFKYSGSVKFYVSDDSRRVPVLVESEASLGKMILRLESYRIGE
jgi:hypothetical protein